MNQTEWIIPCNPQSYNLQAALTNSDEVYWRQNARYEIGDIIYIYLSKGVSAIRYKAIVIRTDIEIKSEDDPYWIDKTMQSQKLQRVLYSIFPIIYLSLNIRMQAYRSLGGKFPANSLCCDRRLEVWDFWIK